jgi:hypothetical protein
MQNDKSKFKIVEWIPAFAGMTNQPFIAIGKIQIVQ